MRVDHDPDEPEKRSRYARDRQTDLEHLRLLSIFYYVLSGLAALCAMFPIIHLVVGIMVVAGPVPAPAPANPGRANPAPFPPQLFGWFFIVIAGLAILFGWAYSIVMIVMARLLRRRRRHTLCLVLAGIACLQQPFGLVLGIFSLIVLTRRSVKTLFEENALSYPDAESDDGAYDRYQHG